uniref:Uncharacterized protein n=1 Tax=Eutreptiella gymnastica TaxID=73025 RepID=A0A7S1J062_9EUGL|mmetsp:Transcript_56553/g.100793  ORF Transcript_56553/g.100793 Transcript_56553/m.100793 type:complete len:106 (+) Transcript_56553:137-454(+)
MAYFEHDFDLFNEEYQLKVPGARAPVLIRQDPDCTTQGCTDGTGTVVWPSAQLLLQHLHQDGSLCLARGSGDPSNPVQWSRLKVLELGSGTGALGECRGQLPQGQ